MLWSSFSAAVFGAVTFGTDIDIRILRGKATNLFSNFDQVRRTTHPHLWPRT